MESNSVLSQVALSLYASCKDGAVRQWYSDSGYWQGTLRSGAATWRNLVVAKSEGAESTGHEYLLNVNNRYKTRAPHSDLLPIYRHSLDMLEHKGWLQCAPCFYDGMDNMQEIADAYMTVLLTSCNETRKRHFSLVSKWLHFSLPKTFPIYDQHIAASIKTWSEIQHSNLGMTNLERLQYNIESRHWAVNWSNPRWYLAILQFYRLLWQEITELGIANDMTMYANEIEATLKLYTGSSEAALTVASLMDTHLWLAGGCTTKLMFTRDTTV